MKQSYILAYTLRHNHNGKDADRDFWEVFCEYNEAEESPKQQADKRLAELICQYENDDAVELYTWNIAAIVKTNEHYDTGGMFNLYPESAEGKWDDIEVSPVWSDGEFCDVCDEGKEHFWSVYLHQVEGGVQCVADVPDMETARKLEALLELACQNREFND